MNLIANLAWALGVCGCGPGMEMEMEIQREMEVIDFITTIEFYTICGEVICIRHVTTQYYKLMLGQIGSPVERSEFLIISFPPVLSNKF